MKDSIIKQITALLAFFLVFAFQAKAQLPIEEEELLRAYGADDTFIESQREIQEILDRHEADRERQNNTRTVMLILSLAVAAVPLVTTCRNIVRHPELRTGKGVASALGVSILGGAVLFGFNYGWMYLKFLHGDAFNFPLAILFTLALAGFAIYLLKKKG